MFGDQQIYNTENVNFYLPLVDIKSCCVAPVISESLQDYSNEVKMEC